MPNIMLKNVDNKKSQNEHITITKDDLFEVLTDENKASKDRDWIYKKKLLGLILDGEISLYKRKDKKEEEKIFNEIDLRVDDNPFLFGFTFFLSSISTFDYNWSYMRAQTEKLKEWLYIVNCFVSCMIENVEALVNSARREEDLELVFNDVFHFTFRDDKTSYSATVDWENFSKLGQVDKNSFFVTIIRQHTILAKLNVRYKDVPGVLLEVISNLS